jgi:hypothetical protein
MESGTIWMHGGPLAGWPLIASLIRYDLHAWRAAHPGGTHWIDGFAHRDATDVFHAFHSADATAMTKRLPRLRMPPPSLPPPSDLTLSFRRLRDELVREGWYRRPG